MAQRPRHCMSSAVLTVRSGDWKLQAVMRSWRTKEGSAFGGGEGDRKEGPQGQDPVTKFHT